MRLLFAALFLVLGLVVFAAPSHAAIVITKVMNDPAGSNTGHQWVAIENTGPDSVDLGAKDIRLFDDSGNHLIRAYGTASAVLDAGESAIIAQNPLMYMNDFPSYSGTLLKSSFKLSATAGEVGILQTDGGILAQSKYVASPKVKQIVSSKSTNKGKSRASSITSTTSKSHGKGTVAPATTADAAVAGALPAFSFPSIPIPAIPLFSSPWFAGFLGLLAFSSFSLILIQQRQRLYFL
jgi:hypothetical protein